MQQISREKALKRFRDGKLKVLVATDVAARGIDVADVTHVVNYSCPEDEKTYVHRIGRTGRAGASGVAVTFVDWADVTRWKVINRMLDLPFDELIETYSTSEHYLHDMGIPPGTTGRLVPARPPEPKTSSSSDRPDRKPREDRPRRDRNRSRTRSGQPVDGAAPAQGGAAAQGDKPQGNRSRNRRRRRSGSKPAGTA
jgi:superfamily II DNA/RNA helicase